MNQPDRGWAVIRRFIMEDVWSPEFASIGGAKRLLIRCIQVVHLVVKGFREDALSIHAAAMTFSMLMSLVPVLAIAFAVLKGLGAAPETVERIRASIEGMPAGFRDFVEMLIGSMMRTTLTTLGWVGVVVLFVTVVQTLSGIEDSFNRIWGVERPRAWWRRIANYISMTVMVPVLVMAGFGINATLQSASVIERLGEAAPLYRNLLRLSPFLTVWAAFTLLIRFMPNTDVHLRPALASAGISALGWLSWQEIYIHSQVSLARYNAIYGTFASVPIFLLWLYVGCMIVLFGAELAFALQNHHTFALERAASRASTRSRTLLAWAAVQASADAFRTGARFEAAAFAERHRYPVRLLNDVLRVLCGASVLVACADEPGCYVLARDPSTLSLDDVHRIFSRQGADPAELGLGDLDNAWQESSDPQLNRR